MFTDKCDVSFRTLFRQATWNLLCNVIDFDTLKCNVKRLNF